MGRITNALRKAAQERMQQTQDTLRIKERDRLVIEKMENSKVDSRLITYFDPKAVISEQYKILTTNILSLNKVKPPKVIVVTSSVHSEGKTVTVLNLAVTMSQALNKPRILVIDADMRKGKMCKYLGVEPQIGLSEVLEGKAGLEQALFTLDVENLSFLANGQVPHNPAELLGSEKMRRLLGGLKADFDHIIIDTPPVIAVTDPGIVRAMADGVLLVVQAGRTQRGIVKRATELLQQAHARVLGPVLTNIEYFLPEYIYRYL